MGMQFGKVKGFGFGKNASKSNLLLSLPLTADLLGRVAGGVTFTRASAQWGTNDAGALVQVASGIPFFNSKGILCEPASTNKCTCYGTIPADSYGSTRTSTYTLIPGVKYEIITRAVIDFTTVGAASNVVGTQFIATGGTLGAGDSVKDVLYGIGTKSYYTGGAWKQNHTNMTLSGDTAAILTTADESTALLASGYFGISATGKAYRFDNTAGVTAAAITVSGATGNTNAHSLGIRARAIAGGNKAYLTWAGPELTYINSPTYAHYKFENAVAGATYYLQIRCNPGEMIYFFLPQMEELPACTSPMPCQGATATRAATVISFPVAGNTKANDFTIYCEVTLNSTVPTSQNIISTGATAGSGFLITNTGSTSISCIKFISGAGKSSGMTTGFTAGTPKKLLFRVSSASGEATFAAGVKGLSTDANTTDIVYSGTTVTIGSYQAGTGVNPFYGYVKNFKVYKTSLFTDTQCNAMTA